MAAYDGEFCSNVEKTGVNGRAGYTRLAAGAVYAWGNAPPPDVTPPTVTLVSPAQGEITADSPIVLRVTDDLGLAAKVILVKYPDGTAEAAWDGSVFSAPFSMSTATPITGGYEIRLVRTLGWPSNPSVEIIAVDSAGHVV